MEYNTLYVINNMTAGILEPKKLSDDIKSKTNGFIVKDTGNFTAYSEVIKVATNELSVNNAQGLNTFLSQCIEKLPTSRLEKDDIGTAIEMVSQFNELKFELENFISPLIKIKEDIVLDNKKICVLLDNLTKSIEQCNFISDYLTVAIEVYHTREQLKNEKPISFEELSKLLVA